VYERFDPARVSFLEVELKPVCDTLDLSHSIGIDKRAQTPPSLTLSVEPETFSIGDDSNEVLHNTVVVLPDLLSVAECESIILDTERIMCENVSRGVKTEKWALFSHFAPENQQIIENLLQKHVLEFIELRLPNVANSLFQHRCRPVSSDHPALHCVNTDKSTGTGTIARDIDEGRDARSSAPVPRGMPMSFYWDDPVVIKYIAGNRLAPHEDMRELTIVVPLNPTERFPLEGGGTRFWLEGTSPEDTDGNNGVLLTPPPGSGIVFNGDITHSGNSVHEGTRFVLMTSINMDMDSYD
jgi:hypothetical protein